MLELTQTSLYPEGNCWQTCIASLLDLDPAALPSQPDIEHRTADRPVGGSYSNAVNAYLRRHHGLFYTALFAYQMTPIEVRAPGWHMLEGETVRTPESREHHVVIGRYGEVAWDPHPSRAGLTKVLRWSFLVPFPEDMLGVVWDRIPCLCSACVA